MRESHNKQVAEVFNNEITAYLKKKEYWVMVKEYYVYIVECLFNYLDKILFYSNWMSYLIIIIIII
jgi:hypothetical protein